MRAIRPARPRRPRDISLPRCRREIPSRCHHTPASTCYAVRPSAPDFGQRSRGNLLLRVDFGRRAARFRSAKTLHRLANRNPRSSPEIEVETSDWRWGSCPPPAIKRCFSNRLSLRKALVHAPNAAVLAQAGWRCHAAQGAQLVLRRPHCSVNRVKHHPSGIFGGGNSQGDTLCRDLDSRRMRSSGRARRGGLIHSARDYDSAIPSCFDRFVLPYFAPPAPGRSGATSCKDKHSGRIGR